MADSLSLAARRWLLIKAAEFSYSLRSVVMFPNQNRHLIDTP